MKLFRFGEIGNEKPGILIDEKLLDVSPFIDDYDEDFFINDGLSKLQELLSEVEDELHEIPKGSRIASCVARPSKIVCIGLNFADHARETGAAIPTEPIIFFKATTALSGPYDEVIIPKNSTKTDWEVELAFVIGKKAQYVEESEAMNYVAGYCLHNDLSEREFQLERGGNWSKGKGCDTFAPLGPWMVTTDEIADVNNLKMWLNVNDKQFQISNTNQLIFKIPALVSYLSQFMTLLPGDVISTGTPHGVGLGFKPPIYLKEGDIMELGIEHLGTQKQKAVNYQ
jgi:2-keto-4-pentenoate hydratase/2-oxohepta-3-ene-1,7-dioic acid hydratase in catechol pathway